MSKTTEILVDVTGLICPLPVLRAQKILRESKPGSVIRVLATDPVAAIDFPHFCQQSGHELLESGEHSHPDNQANPTLYFCIRRAAV